jgi:pimeloyl-ACP methyl ester carboxylesterase
VKCSACSVGVLLGLAMTVIIAGCGGGAGTQATLMVPPADIVVSVAPSTATVQAGNKMQFMANVTGDSLNKGVTWTVTCSSAPCGTISPTATASGAATTYTAPDTAPAVDLAVTIMATSAAKKSASSSASITVPGTASSIAVSVTQSASTVPIGTTAQITATVTGDPADKGVTWSLSCSPAPCGTVSPSPTPSGVATTYTAPAAFPPGDLSVTITATSIANSTVSNSVGITVPGTTVSVTQSTDAVQASGTAQLTASVTNDPKNEGVTWSVSCSSGPCGSVSPVNTPSGAATTYTAPSIPPSDDLDVSITATSAFNNLVSSPADITVLAVTISLTPVSALLPQNISQQFAGTVGNDPAHKGATWTLTQNGADCSPACGTFAPSDTLSGSATTYTAPKAVPANPAATLTATSKEDAAKSVSAALTISAGTVELVPASVNFGPVVVNVSSSPHPITLTNTGNSPLSISGITMTGANPGDFSESNNCGNSVAAGNSCTLTLTFKPKTQGPRRASLSIADDSVDSPQQVSLSGSGFTRRDFRNNAAVRSTVAQLATVTVPSPIGPDKVGTRVMGLIDSARKDPYLSTNAKRELLVRFWYPASLAQACKPAAYASPQVWNYFSQLVRFALPEVVTNSCSEAAITAGTHPVIVFTPGYTATFTDYTFIFEDLASRGYVIASVDHTFEATAVEFPDGRLIKSVLGSYLGNQLRGDNETLSFATSVRLQDLKFVVSELERLNATANSPFAGKLDMSRLAVAGHSMGGAAAFLALERDPRFKVAILIDSYLPAAFIHPTQKPVLLLAAGRENWSGDDCLLWDSLRGSHLAVNLRGAEHVTPSDAVWLAKDAIATGTMGSDKTIAAVRDYLAGFLDTNLRGRPLDRRLTGSSSDYPDAAVITRTESLRPDGCRK